MCRAIHVKKLTQDLRFIVSTNIYTYSIHNVSLVVSGEIERVWKKMKL